MKPLRLRSSTAALLGAALSLSIGGSAQQRRPAEEVAPLNPRFLEYQSNLRQGKLRLRTAVGGRALGYIPPTVDLSHLNDTPFSLQDLLGAAPLPASYDLRKLGRVTAVRNQGDCGSCWTFATMASVESALMPGESRTFSENHLKNTHGRDASPCEGGNGMIATAYLARWSGPVNESDDPYTPVDSNNSPVRTAAAKHLQEMILIPARSSATDNDNVKRAVTAYGAVEISIYYDDSNYNESYKSYNYMPAGSDKAKTHNHAVAVVGWDDNFDRNHFTNPPPGNGAFILRNSWGKDWGDSGYGWLPYNYVLDRLALDFWSLISMQWVDSQEFGL